MKRFNWNVVTELRRRERACGEGGEREGSGGGMKREDMINIGLDLQFLALKYS